MGGEFGFSMPGYARGSQLRDGGLGIHGFDECISLSHIECDDDLVIV